MKVVLILFALVLVGLFAWWWFGYKQLNDSTFADVWVKAMASSNPEEFYKLIGERGWTMDDIAVYTVDLLADKSRLESLEKSIMRESPSAAHEFMLGYLPAFMQAAYGY